MVLITTKNVESPKVERRLIKGSKVLGTMKEMIGLKLVSRAAKISMLYTCEIWMVNRNMKKKLKYGEEE